MTKRPQDLKLIRLELARSKEFPNGSETHGYEFVAPLDGEAHIDPALWRKHRDRCRVRRFWDQEAEVGHLVHRPGGPEHAQWVFDYTAASPNMTTRLVIVSRRMPFALANTFPSVTLPRECTPFVSSRSGPQRKLGQYKEVRSIVASSQFMTIRCPHCH